MSSNFFVNVNSTPTTSNRNFEKSVSLEEKKRTKMTYRASDLPNMSRHLSENTVEPVKQNFEDLVSCTVCYDIFDSVNQNKLPKILPCQHTYCVQCIKNLMHISNDPGKFCCPQCSFQVDRLKDPADLPTSRIVLALLEKDSLNYQGYASCPSCKQIRSLEVCFECNLPLCTQCIGKHFENWKNDITQSCINAEKNLESYKHKLDQVGTLITQNFENVQNVKDDIEEAFRLLIIRLNTEKEQLLKSVNEVKEENAKYVNIKKDIVELITNFKLFRETNESFEKRAMMSRMKKCQIYFEKIPKLENEFALLASSSFKVLDRFEKRPLPESDFKFTGNLVIGEINLESIQTPTPRQQGLGSIMNQMNSIQTRGSIPKLETFKENIRNVSSVPDFNRLKPNAPIRPTQQRQSTGIISNNEILSKWVLTSQIKPQSEITIPFIPVFMSSYQNLLFCMDQNANLSIYEKAYSVELKLKNTVKLSVPNIRSISVNNSYLAVGYSGLKKEQLKGALKNIAPCGIFLYRRDKHVVCSMYEKLIDMSKNDGFRSVAGIALTEDYLYVCDRELHSIFKFDLKSGNLINSALIPDCEPNSISVNQTCITVIDCLNSVIYLLDSSNLVELGSMNLKTIDQLNGNMNCVLTVDNVIFLRNSENQLSVLDSNLEQKAYFNEIQAKITNLSFISDTNNQMLVIGALNNKQQFKIYGYTV